MLTLEQRCAISERINTALEMVFEELNPEERQHAEHILHERFRAPAPATKSSNEMNAAQAREFSQSIIPFGINKGRKIADVKINYLIWLLDDNEWKKKLRAYIQYEQNLTEVYSVTEVADE